MLRVGKVPPGRQARHIPPPPATPPPEPPSNGINVREQVSVFNAASHRKSDYYSQYYRILREIPNEIYIDRFKSA